MNWKGIGKKQLREWVSRHRKLILWIVGGLFALLILLVLSASKIAQFIISQKIEKIEQRKQIDIELIGFELNGLSGFHIESLDVIPLKGDTLLSIRDLSANFNFWKMLLINADLTSLQAESINCRFIKKGNYCNYNFLFSGTKDEMPGEEEDVNYAKRLSSVLNTLFGLIPSELTIRKLDILSVNNNYQTHVFTPKIEVKEHQFKTDIFIEDSVSQQIWHTKGYIDKESNNLSGTLTASPGHKATIPYLNLVYKARISFDALAFDLNTEEENDEISLTGRAAFRGMEVNHARLSPDNIQMGEGEMSYRLNVGKNYIELDSSSVVKFNKLVFNPYLRAEKGERWKLRAEINKNRFLASDLFESLPKGLFHSLDGIAVSGELSYHFLLDVDLANPDSLKLESVMKKQNFKLIHAGELTKMNAPFMYTAYEKDRPVRTFEVGPANPDYRPIESISPLLRMAVLQSEDGQFYNHRGFMMNSLREALIHDIKVKKFARGGSTISMQLVKNVFLNRHKNIARKLEEALVVWLIEENRLSAKERMFEVYLNIAEWGPLVYGANEAARFYFNKDASQLNINEAIFMASIIPSPKRFASAFDKTTGLLKENRYWHFNRIAERLYKTGYITEEERAAFAPMVTLTGVAAERISAVRDSFVLPEIKFQKIGN